MDSNIVVFAFKDRNTNLNKYVMNEIHGFTKYRKTTHHFLQK